MAKKKGKRSNLDHVLEQVSPITLSEGRRREANSDKEFANRTYLHRLAEVDCAEADE